MSSTSETGHAKNVALFKDLLNICASMGPQYAPSRPDLKITALKTQLAGAENAQHELNSLMPAYNSAVAAKDEAFLPLSGLVTRALNAFIACGAKDGEVDNVSSIAKKIRGWSKKKPKKPVPAEAGKQEPGSTAGSISISQMSMDMRIENLSRFVEILVSNPAYTPNEEDLKPTALKALPGMLKNISDEVASAETPVIDARNQRNRLLYTEKTGLLATAAGVKTYLKSIFGATSPEYKRIAALRFSRSRSL